MLPRQKVPLHLAVLVPLALLTFGCVPDAPTAPTLEPVVAAAPKGPVLQAQPAPDVGGRYLVRFAKSAPAQFAADVEALGGTVTYTHPLGLAVVSGLSEAGASEVGKAKGVAEILPDVSFQLDPGFQVGPTAAASPAANADPAGAYFYARQWNLRAIHADLAWVEGRVGSPGVTVAILDSGIDYMHPDLYGLVDLSRSTSFVPSDDAYVDYYFPGRNHVTDLQFHGTHVAATVASNGLAAAGVTSGATLMGVKVCDVFGGCAFSSLVSGILYAVDQGADVMNISLGGMTERRILQRYVGFINQVFNFASSRGVTIVVSAGNDAMDMDHDKNGYKLYCSAANVICVSATGPTSAGGTNGPWFDVDAPTDYTNYGRSSVTVAAPGGSNAAYIWAACSTSSLVIPVCQTGVYVVSATGTSMAAPHVAGLAALVVEDVGRRPGRVKTAIQQGADDLGQPGVDPFYGKGRINVFGTVRH